MDNFILTLSTFPSVQFADDKGMTRYRKELVKVGRYIKDSTKQAFEVTQNHLYHWVEQFNLWTKNGNRVPIPLGHAYVSNPEKNRGWVVGMHVEDNVLVGVLELSDEKLALTTDVSICVRSEFIDGKGVRYIQPITHVALCTDPVVSGLKGFEQLSLSLGEESMLDFKKVGELLGIKEAPTEELVLSAITKLKDIKPVELSQERTTFAVDPTICQLMGENRQAKLSTLLSAGLITADVKTIIEKKFVETGALTLSLSKGADDGFNTLFEVLMANKPVALGEVTKEQLLELSNTRAQNNVSPVTADVNRRRELAGVKS